jgi:hypothetical protein
MVGSCEHGNEPSSSVEVREYLNLQKTDFSYVKESAPWS